MNNIRNAVSKREIVKYLKLRARRIHQEIFEEGKSKEEISILKKRHSEIGKLLQTISEDTIREKIDKMHRHQALRYKDNHKKQGGIKIMEKDIGKIEKGEFQGAVTEIVIGVREYNEKAGLDIREFVTSDRYTGPTKKGLRIPAEKFKEFKEMINSVTEEDFKVTPKEETPEEPKEENLEGEEEQEQDY